MDVDLMNATSKQLDERVAALLAKLSPRSALFAQEHAAGATAVDAARRAGLSAKGGAPYKQAAHPLVVEMIAILRELARRRAVVTVEGQIRRMQHLGREAEDAGDLNVALAAEDKINKLAGLYPKDQQLVVGGAPVQIVVHTGLPERQVIGAVLPPRNCLSSPDGWSDCAVPQLDRHPDAPSSDGMDVSMAVERSAEGKP